MALCTLRSVFASVLAAAYARHVVGSVDQTGLRSTLSGKCFDLPGDDARNGASLWMWDCIGGDEQQWYFSQDNKLVFGGESKAFKCVELPGGNATNGNQLELWDCPHSVSQTWGFNPDTGTIFFGSSAHDATKCLQIRGENVGDPVEIWDCNGEGSQIWNYKGEGPAPVPAAKPTAEPTANLPVEPTHGIPIQSAMSGMCMDVPGGNTSNGALLWMWDCYGGEAQQWSFQNGQLVYVPSTSVRPKCVGLLGNNATNGNQLGLWDCHKGATQKWGFDSDTRTIRMGSFQAKCLQIGGKHGGDPLEISDCIDGEEKQIWKLHSVPGPTQKPTAERNAEPTEETSAGRTAAPTLDSQSASLSEILV